MSKTLYEEALADVRQLKEVAESNAKRAIIEAVTPRIKDLIERQLIGESVEDDSLAESDGATGVLGVTHPAEGGSEEAVTDASTTSNPVPPPVTGGEEKTYEVTSESMSSLLPLSGRVKPIMEDKVELKVYELSERTNELVIANQKAKLSEGYVTKIDETIQEIEDMYSYVQESGDFTRKSKLESKLEQCFSVLNAVKETTMRMKDLVSEASLAEDKEVTLKVTGLPDDVELDKLNIDIISDEDEEMGAMPDVAAGAEPEMPGAEVPAPSEMDELAEDEVVEISESMLRREIARMKKLAEGEKVAPVNSKGESMSADILSDFGGGSDEGDAWLDGEVSTADKDNMVKQGAVKEAADCGDMAEGEDMMDETQGDIQGKMDDDHLPEAKALAAAKAALKEASRKAETAKEKFTEAKATYAKYKGGKFHAKAYALAEGAYKAHKAAQAKLSESESRVKVATKAMNEALKNSSSKQLAESKAANESLRKQLVETNLLNAKLIHANKLLQNEGLTAKQKATIIDKLDEAQNLREVKLVYESLVKALSGDKKQIKEGASRTVIGSSSRPVKAATAKVTNEGVETDRWAVLAGLSK